MESKAVYKIETDKLELIHTEEEFSLKINGNEIPEKFILEYSITVNPNKRAIDLSLNLSFSNPQKIIVESDRVKLL